MDSLSRSRCFWVLLILELTIGRNKVSSKESEGTEKSSETRDGTFTKNDVNFFGSPRISREGPVLRLKVSPKPDYNSYESGK